MRQPKRPWHVQSLLLKRRRAYARRDTAVRLAQAEAERLHQTVIVQNTKTRLWLYVQPDGRVR